MLSLRFSSNATHGHALCVGARRRQNRYQAENIVNRFAGAFLKKRSICAGFW